MEIVLPDGSITTASETNHADLFKALKGAGQENFGIVTRFTMEAYPNANEHGIWYGMRNYAWDKHSVVSRAHTKYIVEGLAKDPHGLGQFQAWISHPEYGRFVMSNMFHMGHKSAESWPETFEHYRQIEAWEGDSYELLPMTNFTVRLDGSNPYGYRNSMYTFSFKPSAELEDKLATLYEEAAEKDVEGPNGFVVVMQPLSKAAIAGMKRHGGNVLGLKEEDGPLVIWLLPFMWKHAKDDEIVRTVARELLRKSEEAAKELGLLHRWKYINYAEESQDAYMGYGIENLMWLKQLQKKYDPEGIFTNGGLNSGYFKLNEKGEAIFRIPDRDEL